MGWVAALSEAVGAEEAGVRLLLGQLSGYPILLVHRTFIATRASWVQQIYFFLTGLIVGHWVIGNDVVHSLYAILGTYLLLQAAGGTLISVVISFVLNFGYLLVGYWYTASDNYDICWTMPHCVLCLRLIGLTFDCYDGKRASLEGEAVLSKDQQKAALPQLPGLLDMLAHSFFVGGYFVGPQFTMRKFLAICQPDFQAGLPASPLPYAFKRLGLGVVYMLLQIIGAMYFPLMYPSSPEFLQHSLPVRFLLLGFWGKVLFSKYIAFWLTAEGVCVLAGLGYNGVREADGRVDWSGCANVRVRRLETASKFSHLIESFNINTNGWAASYVYKRLKFFDNRIVSQVATLVFLSVWHGFHSGYHITFFTEFITVNMEKELMTIAGKSEKVSRWTSHPGAETMFGLVGWFWIFLMLPQCVLGFALLTSQRYWPAYKGTYFFLFIFYLSWPLWRPAVKWFLGGPRREQQKTE